MDSLPFYIADVFAEGKYAGNQLAVIFDFQQRLSDEQKQAIALEMHYSETTFVLSEKPTNGGYDVRIFTPAAEVPFAGHPTLGTSFIIQEKIAAWKEKTIRLNLKVGQIPVTVQPCENGEQILWMNTLPPQFGQTYKPEAFAEILGLQKSDFDNRFPIQIVSTGIPFPIVPLKSLGAVKRAKCDPEKLKDLMSKPTDPKAVFLFCSQTESADTQIHARMFAPYYGIAEDPATGSANSCLAGYLVRHRYFGSETIDIQVEQGLEINRPSRLYLKAGKAEGNIDIHVGGKCRITAEGKLI